jgi:hypothetical protein
MTNRSVRFHAVKLWTYKEIIMNYLKTFVILHSKILRYRRSCKTMYDHHIRIEPFEYMSEFKIYGRRKEKLVKTVHKLLL